MRKIMMKTLAVLSAVLILCSTLVVAMAKESVFEEGAYASVLTGSDFQGDCTEAYDRFNSVLHSMREDGLETPHSMLMGGDFTMVLFDYAVPGMTRIRESLTSVYPDMDPESLVCIQGNHDNTCSGFTKTGFYDMGEYCLYAINENDFPWMQSIRLEADRNVRALAEDIEENLNAMIAAEDYRPVFVLTHVPLHYSDRFSGGDNRYASYIFNVLNEAGKTLDITFLFGHNHSSTYDDYIGGSVNFMAPGETICIATPDKTGIDCYTEETLHFTYTNCGYIGYSGNTVSETSTDVLTLGVIRLFNDKIQYVKYAEDGLYTTRDVARKNTVQHDGTVVPAEQTEMQNRASWEIESDIFLRLVSFFKRILAMFQNMLVEC